MPSVQLAQSAHNTEKRNRERQREREGEGITCGEAEHILCKVLAVTRVEKQCSYTIVALQPTEQRHMKQKTIFGLMMRL